MNVYLSGPIDLVSDHGSGWRDDVKRHFKDNKSILFFDPVSPYVFNGIDRAKSDYIVKTNVAAINECDLVAIRMMKDQVSIGTPVEMYQALVIKKPFVICTDMESVYMTYFIARALEVVDNTERLCTAILNAEIQTRIKKEKEEQSKEMNEKMDLLKVFGDSLCDVQKH